MGSKVGHPSHGPAASSAQLPEPSSPADRPTVEFGEGWAPWSIRPMRCRLEVERLGDGGP
jgi:hypothetical protein